MVYIAIWFLDDGEHDYQHICGVADSFEESIKLLEQCYGKPVALCKWQIPQQQFEKGSAVIADTEKQDVIGFVKACTLNKLQPLGEHFDESNN